MAEIFIFLTGVVLPETISIAFFFTLSFFARNSTRHLLAAPFSGGAAILIFNIPLNKPAMAVLLEHGTILAVKMMLSSVVWIVSLLKIFPDVSSDCHLDVFFDLLSQLVYRG